MATPGPSHAAPRGAGSRGWTLVPVGTKLEAGGGLWKWPAVTTVTSLRPRPGAARWPSQSYTHTQTPTEASGHPSRESVRLWGGRGASVWIQELASPPTSPWNQHFPAANLSDLSMDFTTIGPPSPANHRREPTESTAESGPSPLLPQPGPWPGPRDTGLRRCPSRTWRRPAPAPLPTRSAEWPLSLSLRGPVALLPHGPPSSTLAR